MGKHRAPEVVEVSKLRLILTLGKPYWAKYRKAIMSGLGTAVATGLAVYTNGITQEEWMLILTSALATAGVYKFPNAKKEVKVK